VRGYCTSRVIRNAIAEGSSVVPRSSGCVGVYLDRGHGRGQAQYCVNVVSTKRWQSSGGLLFSYTYRSHPCRREIPRPLRWYPASASRHNSVGAIGISFRAYYNIYGRSPLSAKARGGPISSPSQHHAWWKHCQLRLAYSAFSNALPASAVALPPPETNTLEFDSA
jgi:hypothetical protein